jgi:hypothetical protein
MQESPTEYKEERISGAEDSTENIDRAEQREWAERLWFNKTRLS